MSPRRRSLWLRVGIALALATAGGAVWAVREARRARESFWLHGGSATRITSLAFSPTGEWLVGGDFRGGVDVWACAERKLLYRNQGDSGDAFIPVGAVAFTADGRLVTSRQSNPLPLVRIPDGSADGRLEDDGTRGSRCTIAARGTLVVRSRYSLTGWVAVISDVAGKPKRVGGISLEEPRSLALSRNGDALVALSTSGDVTIYELSSGRQLAEITPYKRIDAFALSPHDDTIAVSSDDLTLRVFDLAGRERNPIALPDSPFGAVDPDLAELEARRVNALAFSPDGRFLAATVMRWGGGGLGGLSRQWLVLWDLERGRAVLTLDSRLERAERDSIPALAVAFSPSGEHVAVAFGNRVRVLHVPD